MIATLSPTIVIERGTYRVIWVTANNPDQRYNPDDHYLLQGQAAHWLYIALTGHTITQHPNNGYIAYALAARAHILGHAQLDGEPHLPKFAGYGVAHTTIHQWGPVIQPWLGILLYDTKTFQPIFNPHKWETINLISGERRPTII